MHSQIAIQFLHLLVKPKNQHGRHIMCLKKLWMFSVISVRPWLIWQLRTLWSLSNLWSLCTTSSTNNARLDLFARKQRYYNAVPPSWAALIEHIKRLILQAGPTWSHALCRNQQLPSSSRWGWKKENTVLDILVPIVASCQDVAVK